MVSRRFSDGLLDGFFGRRTTINVPLPDGTSRQIGVTEKWLRKMQATGAISPFISAEGMVEVHHYDAFAGYSLRLWKIGEDVDQQMVAEFQDPESNSLYVMTVYKGQESKTMVLKRSQWDEWRAKFEGA
jgi:hypothetical protein